MTFNDEESYAMGKNLAEIFASISEGIELPEDQFQVFINLGDGKKGKRLKTQKQFEAHLKMKGYSEDHMLEVVQVGEKEEEIPNVQVYEYNYRTWVKLANIVLPQQVELLRKQNKLSKGTCQLPHPLCKYDDKFIGDLVTYTGEFWRGQAHGWGTAKDHLGNKLQMLCCEGITVKVNFTWTNSALNTFCVNGDTLIGQATDFYPSGTNANFMFDEHGKEIGKNNRAGENEVFYNRDGSVLRALDDNWSKYAQAH